MSTLTLSSERHKDWDRRLAVVTRRHLTQPPVWGESDCLLRVADAIEAVIGIDPAEAIRGKYKTEAGAAKLLKRKGHKDVGSLLADYFEPVGRLMAQRGDVVVLEQEGQISCGFVTEYGIAYTTTTGTAFRKQTDPSVIKAFKVGR